jgi:hypothetical protein
MLRRRAKMHTIKKLEEKGINFISDPRFTIVSDILIAPLSVLAPGIGVATVTARGMLQLYASRSKSYISNLNDRLLDNIETLICKPEFLEKLKITCYAALSSHCDEKAAYFAQLLNGSVNESVSADLVFEFTNLLRDLSNRQIQLMIYLKSRPDGNEKIVFRDWVDEACDKFQCNLDMLNSEYLRLQGMGLCEKHISWGELDPDFRDFTFSITPLFSNLASYIQAKA